MGRWTQYDEDSYRLPEGMVRTGYDADTGRYIFKDSEGTYVGSPGCRYGPVYPVNAPRARSNRVAAPKSAPKEEEEERPQKSRRRATLGDGNITDALKSLRRSLTTARSRMPWRRGQIDDEEPIIVSRPSSCPPSPPPKSPRLATLPIRQKAKIPSRKRSASLSAVPNNPRTQGRSRRTASEHVQPTPTPSRGVRPTGKVAHAVAAVGTSSMPASKPSLTIRTKLPSRSASTSATKPQRNSRRVASEQVHSRPSIAAASREATETVTRTRNPNYVPKRRAASESLHGSR
ncbi:hypothetical protein FB45DRAFT_919027 [Roridomyces roridus]|uniref:Uncharacterized protein n=1 Tax=Roridomyces roridus TaxID=1738132 RepID=A0AAD7BRE4_9AGAR|nr:hypothetical protein FB45DRAFT_919027 [Roridomyces roridus]